jgi:murein L,D-transpeptidase YafK
VSIRLTLGVIGLLAPSCGWAASCEALMDGGIPSSKRSTAAVARVRPSLEKRLSTMGLIYGSPVFLRIFKETSELELWVESKGKYRLFETYPICQFSGKLGPKLRQGDGQAPEGFYRVTASQLNPCSNYHLSFNLGYPNAYDRSHGRTGSLLMVHGNCVSIGCYAMTDTKIEEIYALAEASLRGGAESFPVHIFPFRMTAAAMERHKDSRWFGEWSNLKTGYDYFETHRRPPRVGVRTGRYTFQD